ncbi:MAG: SIS domain-containing protein [Chloroflexi bacterium]|nr:SIS domain-containing protein [Chloroflexota bacterium]
MSNFLWTEIQAQGDNLRHIIEHLYGPELKQLQKAGKFLRNDKPIVFVGMGSAAYLCLPAEFYLNQQGRYANVLYASEAFYNNLIPALKHTNVVFNSRSGETVEVVKLSQALTEAKIPFVAITNEPESTLARQAAHVVWSDSRKDELVSINIVTGMMLATLILAAEAVGQLAAVRPVLDKVATAMDDTIALASQQAEVIASLFEPIRPVYLLARGAAKGAAFCARLVLEEVSRRPAVYLESSEFRQGPIEVVDDRFGAIIFVADGQAGQLDLALGQDILANGGRVMAVGSGADSMGGSDSSLTFPLASLPAAFRPILEAVPAQVLAYKLAERQGREPGTVRYIAKVITSETGIPKLSQHR